MVRASSKPSARAAERTENSHRVQFYLKNRKIVRGQGVTKESRFRYRNRWAKTLESLPAVFVAGLDPLNPMTLLLLFCYFKRQIKGSPPPFDQEENRIPIPIARYYLIESVKISYRHLVDLHDEIARSDPGFRCR